MQSHIRADDKTDITLLLVPERSLLDGSDMPTCKLVELFAGEILAGHPLLCHQ